MPSGYLVKKRFSRINRALTAVAIIVGLAVTYAAYSLASMRAHETVVEAAQESLALQAETLNGLLEKYRLLPPLLAKRDDIRSLFDNPSDPAVRASATAKAIEITGLSGAGDIVFADAQGRIFASARGLFNNSVIEQTALFEAARQGRLGRETKSAANGERNYVFASAIRKEGRLLGIVAVYVLFDTIEATWSLTGKPIAATDRFGTVFLSNQIPWHLRKLRSSGSGENAILSEYGDGKGPVYRIEGTVPYLQASQSLPLLEWNLHVFEDYEPVLRDGRNAATAAAVMTMIATLLAWIFIKRRENLVWRLRRDEASSLRLERQVRDRTFELTRSNATLEQEVAVRARTEEQLRNAQDELIQAAKLAALGQMSATLSHEFNQPLAAIAAQADNARRLIEKDKHETASEALGKISGLVQRMSTLSRTLLTFARKPGTELKPVLLGLVLDEALVLVNPRIRKTRTVLDRSGFDGHVEVMAGRIRLTQVLINLLNNAIDAMEAAGGAEKRIVISSTRRDDVAILAIEDHGPGIAPELRERIFDPFFTTKEVGEGLGIGLSVVFNIIKDFGGRLTVTEGVAGGARFEIELQAVTAKPEETMSEKVAAG